MEFLEEYKVQTPHYLNNRDKTNFSSVWFGALSSNIRKQCK